MGKKLTTEEFIAKARQVHGDKYDYSKVNYVNATTKVCIICPEHGEFWQQPYLHLHGNQCSKCRGFNRTTEEFIQLAKKVHGDKYDYSKTVYTGSHNYVTIICPKHGEFKQMAKEHLKYGCKKCSEELIGNRVRLDNTKFIKKAMEIHGYLYDYSKVDYKGCDVNVCIICPEHGEFWQTPHTHLSKKIHGCPFCANEKNVSEERLFNYLMNVFNGKYTITRQKKFSWLKNKKKLSIDFYIEELGVGIEYQGIQHYTNIEMFKNNYSYQHMNDMLKIKLCKEHNVKLLHFSYDSRVKDFNMEYKTYNDLNQLIKNIRNDA